MNKKQTIMQLILIKEYLDNHSKYLDELDEASRLIEQAIWLIQKHERRK